MRKKYGITPTLSWDLTQRRLVTGLPTRRGNFLVPSLRVKQSKKTDTDRLSRNVGNQYMLLDILEVRRPSLHLCRSLQSLTSKLRIAR
jgi:hypothetical protein